jgi:hypothetical protein
MCRVFVFKSCKGFEPDSHLFCCQMNTCKVYRLIEVQDFGIELDLLEPLVCYGVEEPNSKQEKKGSKKKQITITVVVSAAALVVLLLFALCALHRHGKAHRVALEKEAAMRRQMSTYQAQLEREKEQSKNEKAELAKMRAQYKMLAMDLLANTGASGEKKGKTSERDRERKPGGKVRDVKTGRVGTMMTCVVLGARACRIMS